MNWNNIEISWKEFAEFNKTELIYDERNLFHTIESKYKVDFETEYGKTRFIGVLWKSTEGHNKNKTRISTKFKVDLTTKNLELKHKGILNLFSKNNLNDFEKSIYLNLKNLNGKSLSLSNNVLEFELDRIITSKPEFDKATELIKEIKNYRSLNVT